MNAKIKSFVPAISVLLAVFILLSSCGGGKKESTGLKFTSNNDGTCALSWIGSCRDTDIIIPITSPDGDRVASVYFRAFFNRTSIKSITIPDSVSSISVNAFDGCTELEKIIVNANNSCYFSQDGILYTHTEDSAFYSIFYVPEGVNGDIKIKDGTLSVSGFSGRTKIKSLTVPNTVEYISSDSFCDWTREQTIYICKSLYDSTVERYKSETFFGSATVVTNVEEPPEKATSAGFIEFFPAFGEENSNDDKRGI